MRSFPRLPAGVHFLLEKKKKSVQVNLDIGCAIRGSRVKVTFTDGCWRGTRTQRRSQDEVVSSGNRHLVGIANVAENTLVETRQRARSDVQLKALLLLFPFWKVHGRYISSSLLKYLHRLSKPTLCLCGSGVFPAWHQKRWKTNPVANTGFCVFIVCVCVDRTKYLTKQAFQSFFFPGPLFFSI